MTAEERQNEERRQLRPYRRFVLAVFGLTFVAMMGFMLRGIIRHLDRMPSIESFERLDTVDSRALRACAEDLLKLEIQIRTVAGTRLAAVDNPVPAEQIWENFERDRLTIVARCQLDDGRDDSAAQEVASGADALELLIRGFALLEERHTKEVRPHSDDARSRLERGGSIAKER